MEAPKKIWINPLMDLPKLNGVIDKESVQYVRKDAFIEKACEFTNKANLYLYHCISEECDLVDTDKMINDFKNYMKESKVWHSILTNQL